MSEHLHADESAIAFLRILAGLRPKISRDGSTFDRVQIHEMGNAGRSESFLENVAPERWRSA